jgi:hypothetical protein
VITGYRRFNVRYNRDLDSWLLQGANATSWEEYELQAECDGLKELCAKHLTEGTCSCGIYILKQPDLDVGYMSFPVLAAVSGWGVFTEYDKGWRIQFSRLEHLWLEDQEDRRDAIIKSLVRRYGVLAEFRARPTRAQVVQQRQHFLYPVPTPQSPPLARATVQPILATPQTCAACNKQHEIAFWPAQSGSVSICQMETGHIVNALKYLGRKGQGASEAKWKFLFEKELERRAPKVVNGKTRVVF